MNTRSFDHPEVAHRQFLVVSTPQHCKLAEKADYFVERCHLTQHDLYVADEIFLTGTGAEIMPVVNVDGREIGTGKPGPVTKGLTVAFQQMIAHAPED